MYRALKSCVLLAFISFVILPSGLEGAPKPNVILILADDLGWKDLSSYGSDLYRTPNMDRLAREGVKFTQAYSACTVCSPTRAALLTGKYPARLRVTDWIPGLPPENPKLLVPDWTKYLASEEVTLAEVFTSSGYATATIGKWHLGGEEHYPEKHGFDSNLAGTHTPGPTSYFAPYNIPTLPEGAAGEYLTDRLGREAANWIEKHKSEPFFLYLPHFAVHTPIQAKKAVAEKYRADAKAGALHTNDLYAAMLESLDDAVGAVLAKLEELKLSENTIIVFTSDNGGRVPTTSNLPLRVGKGSCYEGGTRVPLIIRWPNKIKAGRTVDDLAITMDIYPTLLELTSAGKAQKIPTDGLSLVPLLEGKGKLRRDELFWHYPHYQHYQLGGTTPYGAIRQGNFKLIEFYDDFRVELYNLKDDLGEKNNLAQRSPEKVDALRKRLQQWREEVAAQMPTKNPQYDPSRPEHPPKPKKKQTAG